jgi:hypothetical protein
VTAATRVAKQRAWKQRITRLQWAVRLSTLSLAGVAIAQELRKPRDRRRWHGIVAGYVPYDFRMPSRARYRERIWAPDDPRLVPPQAFGVGWTLNVGRLLRLLHLR